MAVFLAIVAVLSGIFGLGTLVFGAEIVGVVWWILALLSLVSIPVLAYLKRIAVAAEKKHE